MRAQLIEFIAERCISWRNGASANIAFTRSWQSSNVPSTAMLATFGAATVVICRRCTSLMRPCGCRNAMSMRSRPAQASIAAEPVSPEVAPTIVTRASRVRQHVVEQAAEKLQRHVLERERRAVEQLLHEQAGVELDQRHHGGMAEAGIGVAAQRGERGERDGVADERLDHARGERVVRQAAHRAPVGRREVRPGLGHIQPAILGQTGQQHAGEVADRGLAAGGDVAHGVETNAPTPPPQPSPASREREFLTIASSP